MVTAERDFPIGADGIARIALKFLFFGREIVYLRFAVAQAVGAAGFQNIDKILCGNIVVNVERVFGTDNGDTVFKFLRVVTDKRDKGEKDYVIFRLKFLCAGSQGSPKYGFVYFGKFSVFKVLYGLVITMRQEVCDAEQGVEFVRLGFRKVCRLHLVKNVESVGSHAFGDIVFYQFKTCNAALLGSS